MENKLLEEKLNKVKELGWKFKYDPEQGTGYGAHGGSKVLTIGRIKADDLERLCDWVIDQENYLQKREPQKILDILNEMGILEK
jgi:hypothetical protein